MRDLKEILIFGNLAFILTIIFIPLLRIITQNTKLQDIPNPRKVHQLSVPSIGGLIIGFTVLVAFFMMGFSDTFGKEVLSIVITSYFMLLFGAADDIFDIKAIYKLCVQLLVSLIIVISGIRIDSLYGLFGIYEINIYLQYIITLLVIITSINAFNLIDGVDGLAGSIACKSFVFLFIISVIGENYFFMKIAILFIGSIIGFLIYNFSKKKKIFLGNSGTLFLGHLLICFGIFILNHNITSTLNGHLFIVFVFFIPVIDSLRVYWGRILKRKSPFTADKSHLHHNLLSLGFSHKKITLFFFSTDIIFFSLFLFILEYSAYNFTISLFCMLFCYILTFKMIQIIKSFIRCKERVKLMEYSNDIDKV